MDSIDSATNAYYFVYYELLKSKDENKYVSLLDNFLSQSFQNAIQFVDVRNIKKLIFHLERLNLNFAYKITLYNYIKSDLAIKILKSCKTNKNANILLGGEGTLVEKIYGIKECMIDDINYMDHYESLSLTFGDSAAELTDSIQEKTMNQNIKQKWMDETKDEAINRLNLLVKYFGLKTLLHFKIKCVTLSEAKNMKFKKIIKYYNKVIKKIKTCLAKCIAYCNAYIEIEKTYAMMLITSDHTTPLNQFELILDCESE